MVLFRKKKSKEWINEWYFQKKRFVVETTKNVNNKKSHLFVLLFESFLQNDF